MNDHTWRGLLDALVEIRESADRQAAAIAEDCGFYRKRAGDLGLGDEIVHEGTWHLVLGWDEQVSPEGFGFMGIEVEVEAGDGPAFIRLDPRDLVDVKATYVEEPF